jgi:hypothetical protein
VRRAAAVRADSGPAVRWPAWRAAAKRTHATQPSGLALKGSAQAPAVAAGVRSGARASGQLEHGADEIQLTIDGSATRAALDAAPGLDDLAVDVAVTRRAAG